MSPPAAIPVVSAVITRGGRILLTQRRADKDFPFTWECPGGKVEADEALHKALRREILEEIGVEINLPSIVPFWEKEMARDPSVKRPDRQRVRVHFFAARLFPERLEPQPLEGQGLGWFTSLEMGRLELAPANKAALWDLRGQRALWRP